MKTKPKKCRGIGKAKGYAGCGKITDYRRYGLCTSCFADFILNTDAGKILLEKATLKATRPRRELERAQKEHKERRRLPEALKQTQIIFNEYIRKRDHGKPCISSGMPWKPDHDAGHLFSVKQYSALRFNEDNCHGQSIGDNRFKEGNFEEYLINLEGRIGKERVEALVEKARRSKKTVKKWTLEELTEIRKKFKEKIKNL